MTITSVGYGDIVPVNTIERALCCVYLVISGVSWTYVIGKAAGIATNLDPNTVLCRMADPIPGGPLPNPTFALYYLRFTNLL